MRPLNSVSLVASAILILASSHAIAQESNSSWLNNAAAPATGDQPAFGAVPPAPGLPQATAPADGEGKGGRGWMVTSPLANVSWPEVKMPKLHWKPGWGGGASPEATPTVGPLDKVRTMTKGAAQRTRAAWNKTVEKLKWRSEPSPAGASQPGFFSRMFSPSPQSSGPETVPEFLAQERPGSVRR
ncbi:MAG: hypothetical protein AAGJ46_17600 [Planctomycetota bacterium]